MVVAEIEEVVESRWGAAMEEAAMVAVVVAIVEVVRNRQGVAVEAAGMVAVVESRKVVMVAVAIVRVAESTQAKAVEEAMMVVALGEAAKAVEVSSQAFPTAAAGLLIARLLEYQPLASHPGRRPESLVLGNRQVALIPLVAAKRSLQVCLALSPLARQPLRQGQRAISKQSPVCCVY